MNIHIRLILVVAVMMLAIVSPKNSNAQTSPSFRLTAQSIYEGLPSLPDSEIVRQEPLVLGTKKNVQTCITIGDTRVNVFVLNVSKAGEIIRTGFISIVSQKPNGDIVINVYIDKNLDGKFDYVHNVKAKDITSISKIEFLPICTFEQCDEVYKGLSPVAKKEYVAEWQKRGDKLLQELSNIVVVAHNNLMRL